MNTKIVMTSSAILLGLTGAVLTFFPDEILSLLDIEANSTLFFLLKILGALYFAFGMLNWMTKQSLIGGIYNRPIAVANFTHFMIAGIALAKGFISDLNIHSIIWTAGIVYILFAVLFGIILFTHPLKDTEAGKQSVGSKEYKGI